MIEILWADLSALDDDASAYRLSEYRLEKLRAQKRPEARRAGIGAELLLQRLLRRHCPELSLPPAILCGENGKPYLPDCDLYFNLSHSGAYAACALSDAPVGLDIQTLRMADKTLSERRFAPEEQSCIERSADKDETFTEIWCRKESFVKATGEGLRRNLASFSAAPGAERLTSEGARYSLYSKKLPDFFLSVCLRGEIGEPIHIEKTELP